jgi:hypothetical protein
MAMQLQQMDARLGVVAPAAQSEAEEVLCVVCMDAPKSHAVMPCLHQCMCEVRPVAAGAGCAELPGVPQDHRGHRAGVHVVSSLHGFQGRLRCLLYAAVAARCSMQCRHASVSKSLQYPPPTLPATGTRCSRHVSSTCVTHHTPSCPQY